MHKCMPHRRREAWREQSPVYNTRGQAWGGRYGWKHSGERQKSGREDGSWDVSHRNIWREFEAEHDHIDKEFERFKRQIDTDPFGALFGRRLQRLNYQPHVPNFWTSICHSLFGGNEQPMKPKTIDLGKAGKDTNYKTSSTANSTDAATKSSSNVETISENIPNYSYTTEIPLKFDPISGRMVPENTSPSVEPGIADSVESDKGIDIPVKKFKTDQAQTNPRIPETSVGETRDSENLDSGSQGSIGRPEDIQIPSQQSEVSAETNTTKPYHRNEIGGKGPETVQSVTPTEDVAHHQFGSAKKEGIFREGQNEKSQPETPILGQWERSNLKSVFSREHSEKEKTPDGRKTSNTESFGDPRDEDLDLLRSSDIRSSYGSMKEKPDLGTEKAKNRKELERDFDSCHDAEQDIHIHNLRSRARGGETNAQAAAKQEAATEQERIQKENIDNLVDEIQGIYEDAYGKINDQQVRVTSKESQPTEAFSQESTSQAEAIDSSRTNTRPSGTIHGSTQADSQDAILSAAGVEDYSSSIYRNHVDELLENIREFRESSGALLEELVQTIDRVANSSKVGETVRPSSYRILAYDSSLSQVMNAEVTSSAHSAEETPLHPEDIFSYLNNPAKFLPYLAELNAEGYEAVSASGDVLVFKKMRTVSTTDETTPTSFDSSATSSNQVGQGQKETLDQAQSDHTQLHPDPFSSSSPSSSSPTVMHRRETVFTGGPPNWSPYPPPPVEPDSKNNHSSSSTGDDPKKESFLHKTSRRVLLTGIATASTCYAMGVVSEYFRTGGQDGKGPDGFTAI